MYLICHKDSLYYDGIKCSELDPENEIFLRWGIDYQQWHDRHFNPEKYTLLNVNTGSMLQHYLHVLGRWAIAPMSVVRAISHRTNLTFHTLAEPPTPRICYMLINRDGVKLLMFSKKSLKILFNKVEIFVLLKIGCFQSLPELIVENYAPNQGLIQCS